MTTTMITDLKTLIDATPIEVKFAEIVDFDRLDMSKWWDYINEN